MTTHDQTISTTELQALIHEFEERQESHRAAGDDYVAAQWGEAARMADKLMPDLPEASRKGVWYVAPNPDGGGVGDIRAGRGKVVAMGMDYQGKPFRLILPADQAHDLGLAFVAAAEYAERAGKEMNQ